MKETGLMFKAPLVRAILSGSKTQTRRIAKDVKHPGWGNIYTPGALAREPQHTINAACPYGGPGDRIYVRETWADLIAVSPATGEPMAIGPGERLIEAPTSWTDEKGRTRWHYDGKVIAYRANSTVEFCNGDGFSGEFADKSDMPCWRPSIHMPKDYARIWLEITGVRVERLQDISEADCIREGIHELPHQAAEPGFWWTSNVAAGAALLGRTPRNAFQLLWESTGGGWSANPWVWVIDFKRIEKP